MRRCRHFSLRISCCYGTRMNHQHYQLLLDNQKTSLKIAVSQNPGGGGDSAYKRGGDARRLA